MKQITLGEYLCQCLIGHGVKQVFGVAGDYNFTILDQFEKDKDITFVPNRNELNAGYAADAFARLNGLAAVVTTFGVGELSACNAIAGSNSENVPVVHIVGAPPSTVQQAHKLMHHTLMDGDYNRFQKVYENITAYTAKITEKNATTEIPKALHIAMTEKKPVYLMIPDDLIAKMIVGTEPVFPAAVSSQTALAAAKMHAQELLAASKNSVLLVDVKTSRFKLEQPVSQLAAAMNIPVVSTVYGKGAFDETDSHYMGVYAGACGEAAVTDLVESAGCLIAVGLVWADTNTGGFSAKVDFSKTIQIQNDSVTIGEATYQNVQATDFISALQQLKITSKKTLPTGSFPYSAPTGQGNTPLAAQNYYPAFEQFLKANDIVVVETGTLLDGFSQVRLKKNITYIQQGGWQAIGYAVPAAFGACMAEPKRRVLLFTGDGSLQLTVQEISSMLAHKCYPIIFILNNGQYIVEKYLNVNTENQSYNIIPNWHYTKLANAFGGEAYTATVTTLGELNDAMNEAETQRQDRLCIIEMIPADPMDAPQYLMKSREVLKKQNKNK